MIYIVRHLKVIEAKLYIVPPMCPSSHILVLLLFRFLFHRRLLEVCGCLFPHRLCIFGSIYCFFFTYIEIYIIYFIQFISLFIDGLKFFPLN